MLLADGAAQPLESSKTLRIPRIIHTNFMSGKPALEAMLRKPNSHMRRDWIESCKVHHPQWEHKFWDYDNVKELLETHYPWFLPTFLKYPDIVERSDAIRYFVLYTYGGVYLDLDTECYIPLEPSLTGYDLVLQCEKLDTLTNAQMASVPRHPLWPFMFRHMMKVGVAHPFQSTGPVAITKAWRAYTGRATGNVNFTITHPTDGLVSNVNGPGDWFEPCWYRDRECFKELIHKTPMLRRQSRIAGEHHFSGSWNGETGHKHNRFLNDAGFKSFKSFFNTKASFIEYTCQKEVKIADSVLPDGSSAPIVVCAESLADYEALNACRVVSFALVAANPAFEIAMAKRGCKVTFYAPGQTPFAHERGVSKAYNHSLTHDNVMLGSMDFSLAKPPRFTIDSVMASEQNPRVNILRIQCHNGCEWDLLHNMYNAGSRALSRVDTLIIDAKSGDLEDFRLHAFYQHLYQEHGFLGYAWHKVADSGAMRLSFLRATYRYGARKDVLGPAN